MILILRGQPAFKSRTFRTHNSVQLFRKHNSLQLVRTHNLEAHQNSFTVSIRMVPAPHTMLH